MSPLLILAGLPALAFQPSDHVHIGHEPTLVRRFHVERQHALRHGKAWSELQQGDFSGWQARFDESTGLPWSAWGPGISLGQLTDAASVDRAVRQLLDRNPALIGIDASQLALGRAHFNADRNSWIVRYDQLLDGRVHPQDAALMGSEADFEHFVSHGQPIVWRGGLELGIQHGRLSWVGVRLHPDAEAATPIVSAEQAVRTAISQGPAPTADHDLIGAARVVVPVQGRQGREYRTAWMVRSRTGGVMPGNWVAFVDVEDGELFNVYNTVRYLDGTLYAEHDERHPGSDLITSPLTDIRVLGDEGGSNFTDADGNFSVGGAASASFTDAADSSVFNEGGPDAELSWDSEFMTWTASDATQAELDTFVFLEMVIDWGRIYANDIGYIQNGMQAFVNLNSTCNAYFDGTINFYVAGSGCNNTGRIKDVIFHEWGHGMHMYAAGTWDVDGSVGEGVSDVVSMLETGDRIMAPYFQTSGSGIRDLGPNRVYPDDLVGEVHADGLIFAGAIWDWREIAEDELGTDAAHELLSRITVDAMMMNPSLAGTYDAVVFSDDDDGDLGNGTPNLCEIIDGFGPHGLGPAGGAGGLLQVSHEVVGNQAPGSGDYNVAADLINSAPECFDVGVQAGTVFWSIDDGETWNQTALDVTDTEASGAIPAQAPGTIVQYFIRVEADGEEVFAPRDGEIHPFSFAVGDYQEIYCNDFEDDDGGFTSELLAGENTEGANDWQWGLPRGEGGDPDFAFSGNSVWGNDLGFEEYNGEYQNDRHNRLSSPSIDISGHSKVVLQYRRWLNMEDSYYDQANIRVNDTVIWTNHGTTASVGDEHTMDRQWALHTVEVPLDDENVTLSWEIITDGGLTMGGWNIDDVCLYGIVGEPGGDGDGDGAPGEGDGDSTSFGSSEGQIPDDSKVSGCSTTGRSAAPAWLAVFGLAGLALVRRRES